MIAVQDTYDSRKREIEEFLELMDFLEKRKVKGWTGALVSICFFMMAMMLFVCHINH